MAFSALSFVGLLAVAMTYVYYLYLNGRKDSELPALEVLYHGPSEGEPEVDIVAVHGLGSNADWAWTHKQGQKHINWLRDPNMLPKRVPSARIMIYSYDSKWHADAPIVRLQQCGKELLAALHEDREQNQVSARRPILFVGHSLGGNIIINSLVSSFEDLRLRYVLELTIGNVFLGCPLKGSKMTPISLLLATLMAPLGSHSGIIRQLGYNDPELKETLISFQKISRPLFMPNYCFYEVKKTDYGSKYYVPGIVQGLVVDEDSACIDEQRGPLFSDHLKLNKYSGPEDRSYQRVSSQIARMCKDSSALLEKRKNLPKTQYLLPFGRNENFIGRTIITELMERLPPTASKDRCQRTAIFGLGGVGKSAIALEAAYLTRERESYCSIFWVSAVNVASFENDYRTIGALLKVPGIEDPEANVRKLVKEALERETGKWLLIIDNIDDPTLVGNLNCTSGDSGWRIDSCLPSASRGSILLTTRNIQIAQQLSPEKFIPVGQLTDDEAHQMMMKMMVDQKNMEDAVSVARLLELLTHLPLAIKQAVSYMNKHTMAIKTYIKLFDSLHEKKIITLLSKDFSDDSRYQNVGSPVATTWLISFEQISDTAPLAAEKLKTMAFLAEKDIPKGFLFSSDDDDEEEIEIEEALGILKGYGFITEREDGYDWHRLVRLCTLKWITEQGDRKQFAIKVVDRLSHVVPENPDYTTEAWEVRRRYLPHTRYILDRAFLREGGDSRRKLLRTVGDGFQRQCDYADAEQMHAQCLELSLLAFGQDHPETDAAWCELFCALYHKDIKNCEEEFYSYKCKFSGADPNKCRRNNHAKSCSCASDLRQLWREREAFREMLFSYEQKC